MRRIGIMGGTFNPVHTGHLMLAEWARSEVGLEEVWLLPAGMPYMKPPGQLLPGSERLYMTKLAAAGNRGLRCLDIEVCRTGDTYSYETLEQLNLDHPDCRFYFILGADCLFTMENWRHPERLFAGCTVIAASRGDIPMDRLEEKRVDLERRYGGEIVLLPFLNLSISSTMIRERVRTGLSVRYMVPDKVLEYMEEKGFYREKEQ
ncbi:MAG: nicotinate-nucleotide adenylyltransferase [Acetatifactor sp.]|nr:nicotinate-nucleotide adenylyltransferase [Acetatifactor sp.]